MMKGNENTFTAEMRDLNKPIIARQIRIVPVIKNKKISCLRFELYGCPFKDDILSYEVRDGLNLQKNDFNLQDKIYDGQKDYNTNQLYNGHGLLTDGDFGNDDFKLEHYGIRGYDWLGWRNDTDLKIKFNFDTIRNFTLCIIYVNNRPSTAVELFSYVRLRFSIDGYAYENEVNTSVNRDTDFEMARPILIPLNNFVGKFVELDFGFYARYLLLSEITFESTKIQPNTNFRLLQSLFLKSNESQVSTTTEPSKQGKSTDYLNTLSLKTLVMALICSILFLILVVLISFYYVTQLNRRKSCSTLFCKASSTSSTMKADMKPTLENKSIQSGSYESTYLYPSLKYNMMTTLYRNQPKSLIMTNDTQQNYAAVDMLGKFMKLTNNGGGSNLYYTIKPMQPQLPLAPPPALATLNKKPEFMSVRKIGASSISFLDKIGESLLSNFYVGQINTECLLTTSNTDKRENVLIKVLKNEHDPSMKYGFDNDVDMQILNKVKIPNANLIELIGICDDPYCYIIDFYSTKFNLYEYLVGEHRSNPNDASLSYANLLCISVQIANAMSFLESGNQVHKDISCKNCIIYVNKPLSQLTKQDIVVKVCDVARYTYDYRNDYSILLTPEQQQQPLKLRWCAWETICTGKFTIKSDVWSFAVLLYELQTMCVQLPYCEFQDENLLALINQQTHNVDFNVENYLVKQLDQCSIKNLYTKELFDLMCQCWNLNLFDRPTFKDINLFLAFQLNGLSS
jgi:discoidin domain receptor family protein 2